MAIVQDLPKSEATLRLSMAVPAFWAPQRAPAARRNRPLDEAAPWRFRGDRNSKEDRGSLLIAPLCCQSCTELRYLWMWHRRSQTQLETGH